MQKATVRVHWPFKFEAEGHAFRKMHAERIAAAAACLKLKVTFFTIYSNAETYLWHVLSKKYFCVRVQELGIIGPDNQLPKKRSGRVNAGVQSGLFDKEDDLWTENVNMNRTTRNNQKQFLLPVNDAAKITEAISQFPHPKSLITRVIQVATSPNRIKVCSCP